MQKFIYVFSREARDRLIEQQYTLLQSDTRNDIYVFAYESTEAFSCKDVSCVLSDTLVF